MAKYHIFTFYPIKCHFSSTFTIFLHFGIDFKSSEFTVRVAKIEMIYTRTAITIAIRVAIFEFINLENNP